MEQVEEITYIYGNLFLFLIEGTTTYKEAGEQNKTRKT